MKLLLDTHTLIWYALADPQLSPTAIALVVNGANDVWISPASYWEIAIKVSIGKLALHAPLHDFLDRCLNLYRFRILPIEPAHVVQLANLPFPGTHRDPFDRLLISQALVESLTVVSADAAFDLYPVPRLW